MAAPTKKRVRRNGKSTPLENRSAHKAAKVAAIGTGAWLAGRAAWSVIRFAAGAVILAGAGIAAATLVPKPVQKRIAGQIRDAALVTRDKLAEQARMLTA
jgi:hypothetical protein